MLPAPFLSTFSVNPQNDGNYRLSHRREDMWGRTETQSKPPNPKARVLPTMSRELKRVNSGGVTSRLPANLSLWAPRLPHICFQDCVALPAPNAQAMENFLNSILTKSGVIIRCPHHHDNQINKAIWQHNKSASKSLLLDSSIRLSTGLNGL